jgi:hypothetical protein
MKAMAEDVGYSKTDALDPPEALLFLRAGAVMFIATTSWFIVASITS